MLRLRDLESELQPRPLTSESQSQPHAYMPSRVSHELSSEMWTLVFCQSDVKFSTVLLLI